MRFESGLTLIWSIGFLAAYFEYLFFTRFNIAFVKTSLGPCSMPQYIDRGSLFISIIKDVTVKACLIKHKSQYIIIY